MLLCVDIGNTHIKLGLFAEEEMRAHWRIATERNRLADEYAVLLGSLLAARGFSLADVTGCAVSSVVPALSQEFGELARRYLGAEALVLQPGQAVGMEIHTDYPAEVGSDLIVNALAARKLYPPPLVVISFGTATTFTAVSAEGNLEGVAIAPGLVTGSDALFRSTATLPQVALQRPAQAIGKNTIASIQSGLVFGFTGMVEGIARRMQAELGGSARVIATGGLAPLIAPETALIEAVEPHLALLGLKMLFEAQKSGQNGISTQV